MADSFFGFDPSVPLDDDSGGGLEDTEGDYDALNSETFGSAINGDWENIHENLVRLDGHRPTTSTNAAGSNAAAALAARAAAQRNRRADVKDDHGESDLELNFSRVGMNDFDVAKEDSEGRIQLDPSVWASPLRPTVQPTQQPTASNELNANQHLGNMFYNNPDQFMRQNLAHSFGGPVGPGGPMSSVAPGGPSSVHMLQQHIQNMERQQERQFLLLQQQQQLHQQQLQHEQQQRLQQQQQQAHLLNQRNIIDSLTAKAASMNIMSVEDLERSIRPAIDNVAAPNNAAAPIAPILSQPPALPTLGPIGSRTQTPLPMGIARLPPGFAPIAQNAGVPTDVLAETAAALNASSPSTVALSNNSSGVSAAANMMRMHPMMYNGLRPPQLSNDLGPIGSQQPPPTQQSPQQQTPQLQLLPPQLQPPQLLPPQLPQPQLQQPQSQPPMRLPPPQPSIGGVPSLPLMGTPPPNHPNFPLAAGMAGNNMQFNQRLVQEIQQNHPMLAQFNRPPYPPPHPNMHPMLHQQLIHQMMQLGPNAHPFIMQQMQQQLLQQQQAQHHQQHHMNMNNMLSSLSQQGQHNGDNQHRGQRPSNKQQPFRPGNGNLSEEFDDYANLMSMRDKQWLINIQLTQLRTDTPYLDDFYYTVFRERRQRASGQRENRAHQDNQMNHPFSQPTGQLGQLARITWNQKSNHHHHNNSSGSGGNNHSNNNSSNQRNNGNNSRNNNGNNSSNHTANGSDHQQQRERKNSENNNSNKEEPRTYAPLQFENSLGKLQCGSVTAPRKVIDMDVVGADSGTNTSGSGAALNATLEINTQRKSKQLLIHIESLFRLVLKLEDWDHPTALAAHKLIRDRKETDYKYALAARDEHRMLVVDPTVPAEVRENVARMLTVEPVAPDHGDTQAELLAKVLAGLAPEKAAQMMTVRKGKTLLRRTLPLVKDVAQRWDIWYGICSTLPIIVRKEKDDVDGLLFALFPLFKEQLAEASMDELLKLGGLMTAGVDTRKVNYMFMNKFCISCVIVLLLRAESLFIAAPDTISATARTNWPAFLRIMATTAAANVQANQTLGAQLQGDVLQPLLSHFGRFEDVPSQPLLAALAQQTPAQTLPTPTTTAPATRGGTAVTPLSTTA